MSISKYLQTSSRVAVMLGLGATSASAADLEFYFPVGVTAPAVETIQALTDEWAAQNPQHTVKAVYAGNYEETTTKALTAANAGQPPQVAVLLSIDLFTLVEGIACERLLQLLVLLCHYLYRHHSCRAAPQRL